jgi:hypothetical protein
MQNFHLLLPNVCPFLDSLSTTTEGRTSHENLDEIDIADKMMDTVNPTNEQQVNVEAVRATKPS